MFAMTFMITQDDLRAQLELAGCLHVPSRNLSSPSVAVPCTPNFAATVVRSTRRTKFSSLDKAETKIVCTPR